MGPGSDPELGKPLRAVSCDFDFQPRRHEIRKMKASFRNIRAIAGEVAGNSALRDLLWDFS